jgi:methylthioribose-1-phosphate isomerase
MNIRTIDWKNNQIRIIDQTQLPLKLEYINIDRLADLWKAIKTLKVRGAPALGAAAGLGMYLGIKDYAGFDRIKFTRKLNAVAKYIGSSRPTARNLFWGIERIQEVVLAGKKQPIPKIKQIILDEAKLIMRQDMVSCRKIGAYGAKLLKHNSRVLTICNAGILATIDYGTALGVIYSATAQGKQIKVFSSETRPLLQGARLSAWELSKQGIEVTLIADNTAASLMRDGQIDIVLTGADRIAANGDTANKIGTFNLAVLARYHKIPFYIVAPWSTFDLTVKNKTGIKIEMRQAAEVTKILFKQKVAPAQAKVVNPAFDVTPHQLISGIISDYGIIHPPYLNNINNIFKVKKCA